MLTYFVPFLYLFASLIRAQREPVLLGVRRVPRGKPLAVPCGVVGFATTAISLVLTMIPGPDEKNPALFLTKLLGFAAVVIGVAGHIDTGRATFLTPGTRPTRTGSGDEKGTLSGSGQHCTFDRAPFATTTDHIGMYGENTAGLEETNQCR